ncbi:MAG: thymidine phosphorylase family protein [Gammaproteobacteria bacterium]|jgi:thymidine phosphorylase
MSGEGCTLRLVKLGIDTYRETVIYIHKDSEISRSEGLSAQSRVEITLRGKSIIATLNMIDSELLSLDEASLSNYAFELLDAKPNDTICIAHPKHLASMGIIRSKVYSEALDDKKMQTIIDDVVLGRLSDIYIATFLTACAGNRLSKNEMIALTRAMVNAGQRLNWPTACIVDKHCVGGLPGNRTSLIVVPIVAAFGLTIPKTSSRAITSPAGTADTMEVLAPVDLTLKQMRAVVEKENGCIVWGGSVSLSPADDILIGVEHVLDLDSEGQLVASVLSKKIAAGSNHVVIDIPIGPTAKVRSQQAAETLKDYLESVGSALGVMVKVIFTDGTQPVGRGIGPALEAKDVLAVLHRHPNAPQDLRDRSLTIAGLILEFSKTILPGQGKMAAQAILDSGAAWKKFQAIANAQGGLREIPIAPYQYVMTAKKSGKISGVNNRHLSRIAKLAGAPREKVAGVELLIQINTRIEKDQPLLNVYAQTRGELDYSVNYLENEPDIFNITP